RRGRRVLVRGAGSYPFPPPSPGPAQRPRRRFHAVGVVDLRVSGGFRTPRAQLFQVLQFEPEPAEVKLDVLQERCVSRGQDEPIPAEPVGGRRVVAHDVLIKQVRGRGERDRCTRVTVPFVFNSVGREGLCGFHGPDIKIGPTKFRCLGNCYVHKTFVLSPGGLVDRTSTSSQPLTWMYVNSATGGCHAKTCSRP